MSYSLSSISSNLTNLNVFFTFPEPSDPTVSVLIVGKPVILVVMHHTHDTRRVVAKSSRQVYDPDVCLTVDCLFYNGILLNCSLNDNMWAEIKNHFGVLILETQVLTKKNLSNIDVLNKVVGR